MSIKSVNTILYCTRWAETVEFYDKSLNFQRLTTREWFVEFFLTESARLSIADESRCSIKGARGMGITISLAVDNLGAAHRKFQIKKLSPTPIKDLWGARVFYLYDPEGNRIEFWE
ncbi:putative glyoxalase/dioxygenase/bleomycin resistance protein [Desulforapulum autotrophicum HRM2]|uniref:Glyoxalase/dioxygenase/bleomycin resistance protein n=1 Tax=Desulforapulum autotrophicum (strain ATCC 43914 / DSM 3382 / VKM B-1955 / HRM2) TaxID=177437 RepID=C0QFE2_DESAH|nr:VOC family protein [Desulforapulum autotrophicum]ACN13338.1 putative glyoxalase/dioxygenase/bleomycin resistance protein [Desulforapulum autotrophicum HRM2]